RFWAASCASAYRAPTWVTAAPSARSRATFTAGAVSGTNTSAGAPDRDAAYAKASPALPPEAATIPASGSRPSSRAARTWLNAPRALNDPVCCVSSSFSHIRAAGASGAGSTSSSGVLRTRPAMRAAAAATSECAITRSPLLSLPAAERGGAVQQNPPFGGVAGELRRALELRAGPTAPPEPCEQVAAHAGEQVVAAQGRLVHQRVGDLQAPLGTVRHPDRHHPVQLHDGRRGRLREDAVQGRDLLPVGVLGGGRLRVAGGDRGLQHVGAGRFADGLRAEQGGVAAVDEEPVPEAAVLLVDGDGFAGRAGAGPRQGPPTRATVRGRRAARPARGPRRSRCRPPPGPARR